jgi:hypothetical protein
MLSNIGPVGDSNLDQLVGSSAYVNKIIQTIWW